MLISELLREGVNEGDIRRRYMSHVVETPTSCWVWKDLFRGDGWFYLTKDELKPIINYGEGKRISARRLIYLLTYREIPEGKNVRKTCGVRGCVNPKHLKVE